jgi:hypothetical protein
MLSMCHTDVAVKEEEKKKKPMLLCLALYRVYQNSTAELQEWILHIERRQKWYDNMGPEMYSYRDVRACIY